MHEGKLSEIIKLFLIVSFVFLSFGCASSNKKSEQERAFWGNQVERQEVWEEQARQGRCAVASWINHDIEDVIEVWGEPFKVTEDIEGGRIVYHWSESGSPWGMGSLIIYMAVLEGVVFDVTVSHQTPGTIYHFAALRDKIAPNAKIPPKPYSHAFGQLKTEPTPPKSSPPLGGPPPPGPPVYIPPPSPPSTPPPQPPTGPPSN